MKQTAVEWLFDKLWNTDKDKFTWYAMLKQAKEIEESQIVDAHIEGQRVFDDYNHTQWTTDQAEQYYSETFKSE